MIKRIDANRTILCKIPYKPGKKLFVKWKGRLYDFLGTRYVKLSYVGAKNEAENHTKTEAICWVYRGNYVLLQKGVKAVWLSEDDLIIKDIIE